MNKILHVNSGRITVAASVESPSLRPNTRRKSVAFWAGCLFAFCLVLTSRAEATLIQNLDPILVKGSVKDVTGQMLPGVSILEKGTKNGTSTSVDGSFSITVRDANSLLVISSIGYVQQEVVAGNGPLTIVLQEDTKTLNEVVVVGFGTQKKVNLTGAVSQIDAKVLESRPVTNLGQALQGTIANFNVTISNGNPSTAPSYNVRGQTSFTSGGDFQSGSPFILVDGIEMNPNLLNPEDIQSVTVLKDAAASAIYGARAAFGVVLITTKTGKGKQRVDYTNSFQWSAPTTIPNLMNAYDLQDAVVKAFSLENQSAGAFEVQKLQKIKEYMDDPVNNEPYYFQDDDVQKTNIIWRGNVNPYKEALLTASPMQKHTLSLSGGSDRMSYYGSLGFQNQDGLYKINTDNAKRYNGMLNVSSQVSKWFKVDFKTSFNYFTYKEPVSPGGKGGWWTAMAQQPNINVNMPMLVPASLNVAPKYTDNILSFMDYGSSDLSRTANTLFTISPTITFTPNWTLKADLSYRNITDNQKTVVPTLNRLETNRNSFTNVHTNPDYIQRYDANSNKYTINLYTNYSRTIAEAHNFQGVIGYNREWYLSRSLTGRRNNINPNIPVISQAQGQQTVSDAEANWAVDGIFYRLNYDYKGKYLIESNGRYDATSRFPAATRGKFFPSFSAGWRISEEPFFNGIRPVISDLKLRGSYGSLGNQNVSDFYPYIARYGTISQLEYLLGDLSSRPVAVTAPGLISPFLTWETATTIDFGADVTLFKNLGITFDWYDRKTTNILTVGEIYPAVLGTSSPQKNSGTLDTKGWELTLNYRNQTTYGLGYETQLTLGDYQAKVVKFDNNPAQSLSTLYVGQRSGEIWGYETAGLFQTQEEINNAPSQRLISSGLWFPGDVRYNDLNGDGVVGPGASTVADPGDRRIIGNSTPRYQFGFNNTLTFRNFDLNIFFQGIGKRDLWISNNLFWGAGATGTYETYNNSWTPERTDAYFPAYKNTSRNRQTQTRYLQNGAYMRLKNVAIGYTIPKVFTDRIKLQRVRVSASAFNLFTLKSVPDTYDPELTGVSASSYPVIKSIAFGVQASF
ncbi:hypothetical protein FAES_4081 [Fibrella aestuarina BUZ 2]|uniref:TonB-dependent receptor plug n=1 Tax=Fibrella aestuarina BUZ 2 TaxID=1166018 RepID=I0KD78_9BACT|nr:TonB-dependent receptor [Fibrella aestuarina]CCH02081.1 hypothetical protein FAES_4081 [Fibrella aestuarina BUZ 2]